MQGSRGLVMWPSCDNWSNKDGGNATRSFFWDLSRKEKAS